MSSPGRRRSATLAGLVLLGLAGLAVLGSTAVPPGAIGVLDSALRGTRVLEPGRYWSVPGLETLRVLDPYVREVDLAYTTPEGAALDLRLRVALHLAPDGASELLALGEGSTAIDRIDDAVDRIVTETLRASTAEGALPRLDERTTRSVARALARLGQPQGPLQLDYAEDSPATRALRQAEQRRRLSELRQETGTRILVVGLDGMDWQIAEPLIERGRLPHVARLRQRGAWGNVKALTPVLSPLLWTSVATGVTADRHGVLDFLMRDPSSGALSPVSSRFRRVRALWNLFSDGGLTADVVAWWATWPAEPIRGRLVSDRVAYSLFDFALPAGGAATYPPALFDGIRPRLIDDDDITFEDVRRFVDVTRAEFLEARARIAEDRQAAYRDPLNHLAKILAATRNYHRIAVELLSGGQADLTLVYYQGIDEVGHRFMHFMPPALEGIDPGDVARYGRAVEAFYVYQDELLGELLERVAPDTTVVVVSDHGFLNGADRPRGQTADIEGQPGRWHRPYGVLMLAGPPVAAARLDTTSLLDVAPTVLYLAGLPVADDLDGRVLVEALRPEFRQRFAESRVATYEVTPFSVAAAPRSQAVAAAEEEIVENLRSLGYVGSSVATSDDSERATTADATGTGAETLTSRANLAAVLLASGDLAGAEDQILAALQVEPGFAVARRQLFSLRVKQQRHDEALRIAEGLLEDGREFDDRFLARVADTYVTAGQRDEGIQRFSQALQAGNWRAGVPLARLLRDAGQLDRADAVARDVLARDPRSEAAMVTVFRVAEARGRLGDARPLLERALALNPRSVLHLNWLAIVHERQGEMPRAEELLRRALEANPDHGGSMANLGAFYGRHERSAEAVDLLRRALRIDPGNLDARVNLGSALARLGRLDEAIVEYEAALSQGRPSAEIYNALAQAHGKRGELAAARRWLERSLALDPDQPRVRQALTRLQ